MKKARLLAVILCFSMSAVAQQVATPTTNTLPGLDPFAGQLLSEWKVPGLALGVVQDGQVILARGYGYRNLEEKLPFTTRTLLPIGSTTKSFTAPRSPS